MGIWVPSIAPAHDGNPHFSFYSLMTSPKSSPLGTFRKSFFSFLTLFVIALQTSLIQRQTKDVETPNKLAIVLYSAVIPNSCIRGLLLCSSSERRLYALECPFEQFRPESLRQCINSKVELETRKLSYHSFSVKAVSTSSNH